MTPAQTTAWLRVGLDSWNLGLAAARVVELRTARIAAGGPAAGMEALLMMTEKWQAAVELQADLLARGPGASPLTTSRRAVTHYRRKVAANARRLK